MNNEQRGFLNDQLINAHFASTVRAIRTLLAHPEKAEMMAGKFLFAVTSIEDDKEFIEEVSDVLEGYLERSDTQLIAFYDQRYAAFSNLSSLKKVLPKFAAELVAVEGIAVECLSASMEEAMRDRLNAQFLYRVYAENRDEMRGVLNDAEDAAWELRKEEEENG